MRYLLGFLCVCALGLVPLAGCSASGGGTGGNGGSGGSQGDDYFGDRCPGCRCEGGWVGAVEVYTTTLECFCCKFGCEPAKFPEWCIEHTITEYDCGLRTSWEHTGQETVTFYYIDTTTDEVLYARHFDGSGVCGSLEADASISAGDPKAIDACEITSERTCRETCCGDGGSGGTGGTGGMPACESAKDCDDGNECTEDACTPFSRVCEYVPAADSSPCAGGTGLCRADICHEPQIAFTGPQEDVIGVGQWGLWCTPDEHISYYKIDSTFHIWFTQGEAHHFTSPDFDELTPATILNGNSVPAFGPTGEGFDNGYAGPGSVIRASDGQDLLMLYHAEDHQWDQPSGFNAYYASIGLARSSDEGQTWERLGPVITGRDPKPATPSRGANGAGGPSALVNESDGFIYLYYVDWPTLQGPATGLDEIHVARAPISSNGAPGSWMKYFDGAFSEPGLGGNSEGVIKGPSQEAFWAAFPGVSFNVGLDSYLAVFASADGFYYSTSWDRINWTVGKKLLTRNETPDTGEPWHLYPSLLSPSQPTDGTTTETGYLYYGYGIFNVECHHMVRRPIEMFWDVGSTP